MNSPQLSVARLIPHKGPLRLPNALYSNRGHRRFLHLSKRPGLTGPVLQTTGTTALYEPNLAVQQQKRFLITEIFQALASPFETYQQIKDTKKMLEDVKEDFMEQYELSKVPRINTFEPLPGFYPRPQETRAIRMALSTQPSFLVVFGGSSVGKTALLREVLSSGALDERNGLTGKSRKHDDDDDEDNGNSRTSIAADASSHKQFVVMHIDLRIAGFADMTGLAIRLATQFEQFFETIMTTPEEDGVYKSEEDSEKDGTNHERINAQYRAQYKDAFKGHMFAFKQLRKQYESRMEKCITATGSPKGAVSIGDIAAIMERFQSSLLAYWQFEVNTEVAKSESERQKKKEAEERKRIGFLRKTTLSRGPNGLLDMQALKEQEALERRMRRMANRLKTKRITPTMNPNKRIPVILLDEAHRLPTLVDSQECIKTLLDSFLVLTKQDRLCHVIHTTSDAFYLHWLRALNIAQHTKIFTIQDCSYAEARDYFYTSLLPSTIEKLPSPGTIKQRLPEFDDIWDVFGGRLAHISDYISEFIFSGGTISPQQSSHFTQAYNNVKLHLTHRSFVTHSSIPDSISDGMEFDSGIFSLLIKDLLASQSDHTSLETKTPILPRYSLNYFDLCEKYGSDKINAIVASRIFDITWSPPAITALSMAESMDDTSLPSFQPANALAGITPPKLHTMSRATEKAMEIIFPEYFNQVNQPHTATSKSKNIA